MYFHPSVLLSNRVYFQDMETLSLDIEKIYILDMKWWHIKSYSLSFKLDDDDYDDNQTNF